MSRKTGVHFDAVLKILSEEVLPPNHSIQTVVCDFETAERNNVKKHLEKDPQGCRYHHNSVSIWIK